MWLRMCLTSLDGERTVFWCLWPAPVKVTLTNADKAEADRLADKADADWPVDEADEVDCDQLADELTSMYRDATPRVKRPAPVLKTGAQGEEQRIATRKKRPAPTSDKTKGAQGKRPDPAVITGSQGKRVGVLGDKKLVRSRIQDPSGRQRGAS